MNAKTAKLIEARANADRLHVLGYAQSYHAAGYMGASEAGLADPQAFADSYAAMRRAAPQVVADPFEGFEAAS